MSDRPVIDHAATIRAAIQAMLDAEGDGYVAEQLVIAMGIERIVDGAVESIPWMWTPGEQAHWQTLALLHEAVDLGEARVEAD